MWEVRAKPLDILTGLEKNYDIWTASLKMKIGLTQMFHAPFVTDEQDVTFRGFPNLKANNWSITQTNTPV